MRRGATHRNTTKLVVAATLVLHAATAPIPDAHGQVPAFRVGVDVIALNVTVTDASRRFVTDLTERDFRVLEDGRLQEMVLFQRVAPPLAVALLIDSSASMEGSLGIAQEAAIGFSRQLESTDVVSVVDFDSRVRVAQDFTKDRAATEDAIHSTAPGGSTALYNSVYIALRELTRVAPPEEGGQVRRRAIVLLSDGEDTSSLVTFEEVLDLASRSNTAIYAIGLTSNGAVTNRGAQDAEFVLRRLTQQTGGRAFFPREVRELTGVYAEIKAELASQYLLAYQTSNPNRDGRFRNVAVRLERPGLIARTRPGYYAPAR